MEKEKILIVVILSNVVGYGMLPELNVKENRKESVEYIAKEMDYPPGVCNFLVNTKVGRKLSYIFLKKRSKKRDSKVEEGYKKNT